MVASATTMGTPKKSKELSRDMRIRVQTCRSLGMTYSQIANHIDITLRQVQHVVSQPATPKKGRGRQAVLNAAQRQQLVDFVWASQTNRRMPYDEIPSR